MQIGMKSSLVPLQQMIWVNKTSYLKESKVYNVPPNPGSTSGHVAKQAQAAQPVSYII